MRIALITPTRQRVKRFGEMLESALDTAAYPGAVMAYAVLDPDDPELDQYQAASLRNTTICVQDKREFLSRAFEIGARTAMTVGCDILMLCGDDVIFRTPGWDVIVDDCVQRYPDQLVMVYPSDGHGNGSADEIKANHWFVTPRWIQTVGFFTPPGYEHFCVDTVPERIAAQAGRLVQTPEVLCEHMHFKHLQAKKDETYAHPRRPDAKGVKMHQRDEARMLREAPMIAERAAAVRARIQEYRK